MATVQNLTQYLLDQAFEGFNNYILPVSAFSFASNVAGAGVEDIVRVPYVSNASGSTTFTYAAGFTGNSTGVNGKSVTLNIALYQPVQLTDTEWLQAGQSLGNIYNQAGARLGADFISASMSGLYTVAAVPVAQQLSGSTLTGSIGWTAMAVKANTLKWPMANRSLIMSNTLNQWALELLSATNTSNLLIASSYGNPTPVQNAQIPRLAGFNNYLVSLLPPNDRANIGYATTPAGTLIANAYHKPQSTHQYRSILQAVDQTTGLTIGYREWYDNTKATDWRTIDVLGGSAIGESTGILRIFNG